MTFTLVLMEEDLSIGSLNLNPQKAVTGSRRLRTCQVRPGSLISVCTNCEMKNYWVRSTLGGDRRKWHLAESSPPFVTTGSSNKLPGVRFDQLGLDCMDNTLNPEVGQRMGAPDPLLRPSASYIVRLRLVSFVERSTSFLDP